LRPLPAHDIACCVTRPVVLNPYSQVIFETNRYSVPVEQAYRQLVVRAFPFQLEVLHLQQVIASHPRCYDREQDIFDPLHYLPLLEQRPGAFAHAKPLRRWRAEWPPIYEQLLQHLCDQQPGATNQAIRQFVGILRLLGQHPPQVLQAAIKQALEYGCANRDGVELCLRQLQQPVLMPPALELSRQAGLARLAPIAEQGINLRLYEQLLSERPLQPSAP
jgi:hypothetical protein